MKNKQRLEAIQRIAGFITLVVIIGLAGCGSFGPWEITTPATCTEAAKEQRTSTDDKGKVQTRNSPTNKALGHEGLTGAVAATCTTAGRTASGTCTRCGQNVAAQTIAALGHNWGAWRVVRAATTTAEGQEERTCTRDSTHRETRAIPRLPTLEGTWLKTSETVYPDLGFPIDPMPANMIRLIISGNNWTMTSRTATSPVFTNAYRGTFTTSGAEMNMVVTHMWNSNNNSWTDLIALAAARGTPVALNQFTHTLTLTTLSFSGGPEKDLFAIGLRGAWTKQ
ncbi:MAG: hypothetical protein LBH42_06445 [Treponema sp.]|nr:hypothetical protein [Treponema sp.]